MKNIKEKSSDAFFIGAIVAMTRNNIIGLDNNIPWHYKEDLSYFKKTTLNNTVVMGRKTWESINSKPLPQRRNIVITKNKSFPSLPAPHATCHSIDEALITAGKKNPVWIIGGGNLYAQTIDFINVLSITYVPDNINSNRAICFPKIDLDQWIEIDKGFLNQSNTLVFKRYHRLT